MLVGWLVGSSLDWVNVVSVLRGILCRTLPTCGGAHNQRSKYSYTASGEVEYLHTYSYLLHNTSNPM